MNVFIMAAGSSKRWTEDYPKQMCVVDGEPVIHRTARQLRERGIEPIATAQYEGQWGINDFVTSPNQYEIDRICGVNKEGIYLYDVILILDVYLCVYYYLYLRLLSIP